MPTLVQRLPVVVRCAVIGLQDHSTEWVNSHHPRNSKKKDTFFVERYGTILCAYRSQRQWFIVIDLLVVIVCGVLGGSVTANAGNSNSWCNSAGPAALLLVIQLVMLLALVTVQPYDDPAISGYRACGFGWWGICALGSTEAASTVGGAAVTVTPAGYSVLRLGIQAHVCGCSVGCWVIVTLIIIISSSSSSRVPTDLITRPLRRLLLLSMLHWLKWWLTFALNNNSNNQYYNKGGFGSFPCRQLHRAVNRDDSKPLLLIHVDQ